MSLQKVFIVFRDDGHIMSVWATEALADETRDNLCCCDPGSTYSVDDYDVLTNLTGPEETTTP